VLDIYRRICTWEKSPRGESNGWIGGVEINGGETRQEIPAGVHIRQHEHQIKGQLKNWSRAISEVKWHSLLNNWI